MKLTLNKNRLLALSLFLNLALIVFINLFYIILDRESKRVEANCQDNAKKICTAICKGENK